MQASVQILNGLQGRLLCVNMIAETFSGILSGILAFHDCKARFNEKVAMIWLFGSYLPFLEAGIGAAVNPMI